MTIENPIVELHRIEREISEEMLLQILALSCVPISRRRKIPRELMGKAFAEMARRGWVREEKLWTDPQTGHRHGTRDAVAIEARRIRTTSP